MPLPVARYLWRALADCWRTARGAQRLALAPSGVDSVDRIRQQLVHREVSFLETVLHVIFEKADNPYFHMFRLAHCRYEDLVEMVLTRGLESTLRYLQGEGVYLTLDELRGRTPILRSGREIPATYGSFANTTDRRSPSRRRHYSNNPVEQHAYWEGYETLQRHEFSLNGRVQVLLKPLLPSREGLTACVRAARRGWCVDRWYSPDARWGHGGRQWLGTGFVAGAARMAGIGLPFPLMLSDNDFTPVARWIAAHKVAKLPAFVNATTSYATRVADAALRASLDISGTIFFASGEPVTEYKRNLIEYAGASVYPVYWSHELGPVGIACRQMDTGDCVHFFEDSLAVITHHAIAPITRREVESLRFTTLLPVAPMILINAEVEDAGIVERVYCGCSFRSAGFTSRLRDFRSFGKLTALGIAVFASDAADLVENRLPKRFGGRPEDYQFTECEGQAQTELWLRVSPDANVSHLDRVREFVLDELNDYHAGSVASRMLRNAGAFRVVLGRPLLSPAGKVLPLQLLGADQQVSSVS